jgi:hypothetical protein
MEFVSGHGTCYNYNALLLATELSFVYKIVDINLELFFVFLVEIEIRKKIRRQKVKTTPRYY